MQYRLNYIFYRNCKIYIIETCDFKVGTVHLKLKISSGQWIIVSSVLAFFVSYTNPSGNNPTEYYAPTPVKYSAIPNPIILASLLHYSFHPTMLKCAVWPFDEVVGLPEKHHVISLLVQ